MQAVSCTRSPAPRERSTSWSSARRSGSRRSIWAQPRATNGGTLVTTEIEASKCRVTEANLRQAGLEDVVEVLEGDARETLARSATPIDMLFLDGWKDLYLPLLDQLRPRLERGALIVADNTNFRDAQPYVTHVRTPAHGFVSTTLAGGTMELSYLGS